MAKNAGVEGAVLVRDVCRGEGSYGYSVALGTIRSLVEAGVIDPAKIVRVAPQRNEALGGARGGMRGVGMYTAPRSSPVPGRRAEPFQPRSGPFINGFAERPLGVAPLDRRPGLVPR